MATLRYLDDTGRIQSKSIDSEHFVIGRAPNCQIVIDGDMISREHLRIDLESDGRYRIRDLGSRNKTYVNGEQITETLLFPGDVIRAGDRVVEFLDDTGTPESVDLEFLTPDRTEPPDCEWVKLKSPVSLSIGQVEQLSQLSADQAMMARPEDIANSAIGQIIMDLQAERGFVALRGESKTDLRPLAHRALRRPPGGSLTPVSQSFVLAPVLQSVAGRYPQAASKLSHNLGYAMTALVAPLTFRGDVVGVLYVDRPTTKKPFTAAALQYCTAAGAQLGAMIGEASRKLARAAAREGVAWVSTIRRLQNALASEVTGTDAFGVESRFFSGRARCGDFMDVVHLDELRCCGLVIDGGGHGITGIAQASAMRSAVRAAIATADEALMDPAMFFNEFNRMVSRSQARQVLPCTYVGIDLSAGKLVYINAGGMPPLLMVAPGRLITLDQVSLVLGIDPDYLYETTRVDVPERFRVVCFTDGLVEATGGGGEPLGEARLHEALLAREAFETPAEVVARIGRAYTAHLSGAQADDDAAVIVIGRG